VSWVESSLGESCELYQPQTITTKDLIEDGKYLVYGANGVIGKYDKYNHEEPQLLVTCRGATCGSVNISSPYSWINGNAMVVKPRHKEISVRYLEYFFRGVVDLSKAITGAAQPQITRQSLSPIGFKYPPLQTQQKMVAKLDAIFVEIDKATAAAEANIKNAEDLISSYINYIFNIKTENCKKYKLGDVCNFQGGSQPPKSFFEYEPSKSNIRFIQIRDYKSDKNLVYIPKSLAKRFCDPDEVMIGRYGPPVFQILRGIKGSYNVALMKAVPNEKILTKDYLYYFLKNPAVQDYVISLSNRAAGQSGINKEAIEPYEIYIPSLDEQHNSVIDILTCSDNAKKIKAGSIKKIKEMNLLKKSILQQAFNGELVKD